MTVVETLESARDIDVEVVVARVLLVLDAREVPQQVFMDVERERPGRELLVVDRRVKRECLVYDIDDLPRCVASVSVNHSQPRVNPLIRRNAEEVTTGSTHVVPDSLIEGVRLEACAHIGRRDPCLVADSSARIRRAQLDTTTFDEACARELD